MYAHMLEFNRGAFPKITNVSSLRFLKIYYAIFKMATCAIIENLMNTLYTNLFPLTYFCFNLYEDFIVREKIGRYRKISFRGK